MEPLGQSRAQLQIYAIFTLLALSGNEQTANVEQISERCSCV